MSEAYSLAWKQFGIPIVIPIVIAILGVLGSCGAAYYVAKLAIQKEEQHGGARLLEICRRYGVNFASAIDNRSHQLRTDPLAYEFYTQELQHIVDDLDGLLDNAYVVKLIFQYPKVTHLLVELRRELIERRADGAPLRKLNPGSLIEVFGLHRQLRADFSTTTGKTDIDQELVKLESMLRTAGMLDPPRPRPLTGDAPQAPRP